MKHWSEFEGIFENRIPFSNGEGVYRKNLVIILQKRLVL